MTSQQDLSRRTTILSAAAAPCRCSLLCWCLFTECELIQSSNIQRPTHTLQPALRVLLPFNAISGRTCWCTGLQRAVLAGRACESAYS